MTEDQDDTPGRNARRISVDRELEPILKSGLEPHLYHTIRVSDA
jgi:hypothetical protein